MKISLLITALLLALSAPVNAGYLIYTYPIVAPKYSTVQGPTGPVQVLTAVPAQPYPVDCGIVWQPKTVDRYSAVAADRTILLKCDLQGDSTGVEVLAALPGIRQSRVDEIRAEGSRRLITLATPYSAEERESWAQQQADANEYQVNPNCACTLMRQIATTRGITLQLMAEKILENAALFKIVSGQILGKQQRLLDQVEAVQDFDQLLAIGWE